MLRIPLLELCLRGFPEAFLFIWAINLINFQKISKKVYILASLFLGIIVYLIRLLPIQYGINTILAVVCIIFIVYYISSISLNKAISSSLIVTILLSICEWLDVLLLKYLFGIDIEKAFAIPLQKTFLGLPSLIFFVCFILIFYRFIKRRKED